MKRLILAASLLSFGALLAPCADAQAPKTRPALLIDVKGVIGFVTVDQLSKALQAAKASDAGVLIMRLDTPGGLVSSTRDMIQEMLASPIPIVVYVAPSGARAASAGTYLAYASHLAAMAPGTHLGAATPIALGVPGLPGSPPPTKPSPGSDKPAEPDASAAADKKSINDAVAYMRSLAELRNRNAEWAEKAVRDAATLTSTEALKERVIEVIASDVNELLTLIDGRSVATGTGNVTLATKGTGIIELKPDWKMRVLSTIADPNVAFILLLIGIYGILFEFMNPGVVAPGVIGGISLLVALTSLSILPVNYGGLALLLLGIALMVAEAFTPSFGILGLGGLVAFVFGALFLFDPAESDIHFGVSWPVIATGALTSLIAFAGILGFALQARSRPVRTGSEELIDSPGEVVNWAEAEGHVRVHGEIWAARAEQRLAQGDKVRVVGRDGLTLIVQGAA